MRVKGTVNGVTTCYLGNYFEWVSSTGNMTKNYTFKGKLIAVRKGMGAIQYTLEDHINSTAVVLDANFTRIAEYRYKSWGETLYYYGTIPTTMRFTGGIHWRKIMEEQEVIFSGKIITLYSQVGLVDGEAKDAYPQWKTGEEVIVFGLNGVAVATVRDKQVDVMVCKGKIKAQYALCVSGEILVGNQGILVGNIPAASVTHLPLASGKYSVVIYTDGIGSDTERVFFCVNRLGKI